MAVKSVHVEVSGQLRDHLRQQIWPQGPYANVGDYLRALIRRDFRASVETSEWLWKQIEPGMRADETEYVAVSWADVILRNQNLQSV